MHFVNMSLNSACHLNHNVCRILNVAESSVLVLLATEEGSEIEQLKCISQDLFQSVQSQSTIQQKLLITEEDTIL